MKNVLETFFHSGNTKRVYLLLCILFTVSIAFRFPYVMDGFGEVDAANIAVSAIDLINNGPHGFFTGLYFLDVVPGYYLYLKTFMNIMNNDYSSLASVMNYTTFVFATLLIVPSYYFIKRLFNNNSMAFFTTLTFIFAPSIYRYSIYGFPTLIALFFFIASMWLFLAWLDENNYIWGILSFVSLTLSFLFRANYVLGSGALFGLLYLRGIKEKQRVVMTVFFIAVSVALLLLSRQWILGHNYEGPSSGSTTTLANFSNWFQLHFMPLYRWIVQKQFVLLVRYQIGPIVSGIGLFNFFMAIIVFVYYIIKRRLDIVIFVLSWAAVPTVLWLFQNNNAARHNILSVLPFLIIIFLFIHEKFPRLMLFVPIVFILGNSLLTYPPSSINFVSGDLFRSNSIRNSQINDSHLIAKKIASMGGDKIIFTNYPFRPYLLYELLTSTTDHTVLKAENDCYELKGQRSILCFLTSEEDMLAVIHKRITKDNMDRYTIVSTLHDLEPLKKEGLKIVDNRDIRAWVTSPPRERFKNHFLSFISR